MDLNTINSTTKAGNVDVSASLIGEDLPVKPHEVFIEPLEPARLEIVPKSTIIKSGGLSKTQITINIYDKNDNLVNNDVLTLTLNVAGPGKLDLNADGNFEEEGIQLTTFEGFATIDLFSTEDECEITITAVMDELNDTDFVETIDNFYK